MDKLPMHKFAVADIDSVCGVLIDETGKSNIAEAKSHEAFVSVTTNRVEFKDSFARDKASESTPGVRKADKRRDDGVVGLFKAVDGLLYSPNEAKRGKAEIFMGRFDKFTGIQCLADTKQNTHMDTLIAMLDEPENVQLVKDLGLEEYVVEIKAAEAEFTQAWSKRETDVTAYRNSVSASNLRKTMEAAINRYYDYVDSNARFSSNPAWKSLQSEIYSRYLTIRQKYQVAKPAPKKEIK